MAISQQEIHEDTGSEEESSSNNDIKSIQLNLN